MDINKNLKEAKPICDLIAQITTPGFLYTTTKYGTKKMMNCEDNYELD